MLSYHVGLYESYIMQLLSFAPLHMWATDHFLWLVWEALFQSELREVTNKRSTAIPMLE